MLVEIEDKIVGHDRVTRSEKRDESADEVLLGGHQLAVKVGEVVGEVDFFDGPGVLDRVLVHLKKLRIAHWPQGQVEARVQDVGFGIGRCGVMTGMAF